MAEIVVSRPAAGWANRLRSYKVVVDGKVAATLGRGEHATVTVPGGHHSVMAKLDWGSSPSVDVELREDDRAYLVCTSGFQAALARPTALLYITIWRKRYLDLQLVRVEPAAERSGFIPEHWRRRPL